MDQLGAPLAVQAVPSRMTFSNAVATGGRMEIIAAVSTTEAVTRILENFGVPSAAPALKVPIPSAHSAPGRHAVLSRFGDERARFAANFGGALVERS